MDFINLSFAIIIAASIPAPVLAKDIEHDAEHYVLLHQYQDQWAVEDTGFSEPKSRKPRGEKTEIRPLRLIKY